MSKQNPKATDETTSVGFVTGTKNVLLNGLQLLGSTNGGGDPNSLVGVFMSAGSLAVNYVNDGDVNSSLSEKAWKLRGKINEVQKIGTIAYCAFDVLTDPMAFMNVLAMLMENLGNSIANLVSTVLEAAVIQITSALTNVISSVGNLITSVLKLIVSIAKLAKAFGDVKRNWFIEGANNAKDEKTTEYCEQLIATILACLLNQLLGDPIEKLKNKLVSRINEVGGNINSAIQYYLEDVDVLNNFIEREAGYVGTAAAQVQGFADSMKAQREAYELQQKAKANKSSKDGKAITDESSSKNDKTVSSTSNNAKNNTSGSTASTQTDAKKTDNTSVKEVK